MRSNESTMKPRKTAPVPQPARSQKAAVPSKDSPPEEVATPAPAAPDKAAPARPSRATPPRKGPPGRSRWQR